MHVFNLICCIWKPRKSMFWTYLWSSITNDKLFHNNIYFVTCESKSQGNVSLCAYMLAILIINVWLIQSSWFVCIRSICGLFGISKWNIFSTASRLGLAANYKRRNCKTLMRANRSSKLFHSKPLTSRKLR